jgi:hypothetical protein
MSSYPGAPRLVKGGLVIADPSNLAVRGVISLQYNPDSVTRSLQVQGSAAGGERSEALRLTGPAVETIKLDAELDATDQLEKPAEYPLISALGLHPALALLESLLNPLASELLANNAKASRGSLEIAPHQAPLTLFVWSAQRVMPVRITDYSVVEDGFDENLNPIRARISLGMRVLTVDDLGFQHPGGTVFLGYLQRKQQLGAQAQRGSLGALGVRGLR